MLKTSVIFSLFQKVSVEAAESSTKTARVNAKTDENRRSLLYGMNRTKYSHNQHCYWCDATKTVLDSLGYTENDSDDVCDWEGVTCDESGLIKKLYPNSAQYTGTIGTEIGLITSLKYFKVGINIQGTLPTEIGLLNNLEYLSFVYNDLSGALPSELGQLSNLEDLNIGRNNLSGSIPTELGLLTNITTIEVDYNKLTGTIPSELGLLSNLGWFIVAHNDLTGTVPDSLCESEMYVSTSSNSDLESCPPQAVSMIVVSGIIGFFFVLVSFLCLV